MITRIEKRNLFFPSSYQFSFYEGSDFLPRQLHVAPATGVTCEFFLTEIFLRINRNRRKAVLTGLLRGDFVFGEVAAREGGGCTPL